MTYPIFEYHEINDREAIRHTRDYFDNGIEKYKRATYMGELLRIERELFDISLELSSKDISNARGPEYWKIIDEMNAKYEEDKKNKKEEPILAFQIRKKRILLNILYKYKKNKNSVVK